MVPPRLAFTQPLFVEAARIAGYIGSIRRLVLIAALVALAVPAAASSLVFRPSKLPAGKVGVPYKVVVHVSLKGHNPVLGTELPDFTIDCFGADKTGAFQDDCKRLPPGITVRTYADKTCSPPLQMPACFQFAGRPRKAGTYVFQIYVPNVDSVSARGIAITYRIVVRA